MVDDLVKPVYTHESSISLLVMSFLYDMNAHLVEFAKAAFPLQECRYERTTQIYWPLSMHIHMQTILAIIERVYGIKK